MTLTTGGTVVTGVDNSAYAPDKSVTVSATVTGGNGVAAPGNQTLTLADDETLPTVTLVLTPGSVSENGGVATVTASLSGTTSAATTLTVSPAVAGDFTLSTNTTLTIAALATASSGTVTITGVDNSVYAPDKSVTVSATVTGGNGVAAPGNQTLTLADDETLPTITLTVSPSSVNEVDGPTEITVTAVLGDGTVSLTTDTIVTLTLGGSAVESDYSAAWTSFPSVTIPALSMEAETTLTIDPVYDNRIEATEKIQVQGTAQNFAVQAATVDLVDGPNKAPTANAGSDQVVDEGAEVALNGAASSDPEGEVLTWIWTQQSGLPVTLDDPASVGPTFTAPEQLIEATEKIQVQGTAQNFAVQAATVDLVDGPNKAPTANAGSDQVVDEGAEVALNGAASSDPEGEVLTWIWTQQSGLPVTLDDPASVGPTFTAPEQLVEDATLVFALTVTDARGASATATVTITVTAGPNDPPVVDAGADLTVVVGAAVTLDGAASDPEGEDLTWVWTQQSGPPVVLDDPAAARTTFTAPEQLTEDAALVFVLTVTDARGASGTATVTIVVLADFQVLDPEASDEFSNVLISFVVDENDLQGADKLAVTAEPPPGIAFVSDDRRQIVDITPVAADGDPMMQIPTATEICLFVNAKTREKFAARVNDAVLPDRLRLLHFSTIGPGDPAWMELAGSTTTASGDGLRVCALTDLFSPFAAAADVLPAVSLSATTLAMTEGGDASYTVLLDVAPDNGVVTVKVIAQSDTVTVSRGDEAAGDSLDLTFNGNNWKEPQEVVVGSSEDGDANDGEATIVHQVSGAQYSGVMVADVEVGITDKATLARPLVAKHWLARFGRTVAVHTVEAISGRLTRTPTAASQVTLGGQGLDLDASLPWAGEHAGILDASAWTGRGGGMRDGMLTGEMGPGGVMRGGLRTGEMDSWMSRSMSAGEFLVRQFLPLAFGR